MGLIKAGIGALGGVLADQWKEYFICEAISKDILVVKGQKQSSSRSSNTKGSDNIISNGSGISVADGQCMIIVEQGKIVEVCAEPGLYTYDKSTEPSIFSGSLGKSILDTFKSIGKRFTYGGDTGNDQRVYYFNTKEIMDNKFGTPTPIMFRTVDRRIGLDMDVDLRCNGIYSYKIVDPLLFYTNVCGNISDEYPRSEIDNQLKTEFINALQPALGRLVDLELRPSEISRHVNELADAVNAELAEKWGKLRGLQVVTISMNPPSIPQEQADTIRRLQTLSNPTAAAATLVDAQAQAMKTAAGNPNGAMMGFMGMGMAQGAGGLNAQNLYNMGMQQQQAAPQQPVQAPDSWKCACGNVAQGKFCPECGAKKPEPKTNGWKCACGATVQGKFCPECGAKKPEEGWKCACGKVNQGKFCQECGAKKPSDAPLYKCDKCGWEPEDPKNPPKFCPECGDIFNDSDAK